MQSQECKSTSPAVRSRAGLLQAAHSLSAALQAASATRSNDSNTQTYEEEDELARVRR